MTDQEILQKAIEKAVKNNWGAFGFVNGESKPDPQSFDKLGLSYDDETDIFTMWCSEYPEEGSIKASSFDIIFDHGFAKAFWGEKSPREEFGEDMSTSELASKFNHSVMYVGDGEQSWFLGQMWEYHLQQMVLEENPIKYLAEFI